MRRQSQSFTLCSQISTNGPSRPSGRMARSSGLILSKSIPRLLLGLPRNPNRGGSTDGSAEIYSAGRTGSESNRRRLDPRFRHVDQSCGSPFPPSSLPTL
jgi:hypothetical protein